MSDYTGIVSKFDADKRLGVIKEENGGNEGRFFSGYFDKIGVGDKFTFDKIIQAAPGGEDKMIRILKKKIPK